MQLRRGNIKQEREELEKRFQIEIECRNTGLERLKKAFEKVNPKTKKEVPKVGRPVMTKEQRVKTKDARDLKKGQLIIFNSPGKV